MKGPRHDEELMRLYDGELAPREARAVEEETASSPEDQNKLESLRQVGDVLRARYDAAVEEAAPKLDAMWSQIERNLEEPARAPSFFAGFTTWFDTYRSHVLTGAVCAAAAAIIVFLLAHQPPEVITKTVEVPVERQPENVPPAPSPEPVVMAASVPAEVEMLEVMEGTGTVFAVPGTGDEPESTVIWITGDTTEEPI